MNILKELRGKLKGKFLLLGMGNSLRNDDGFGTILAGRLKGKINAEVFAAGVIPENYLDKIAQLNPDTILIIDAADFGGKAGEAKLFKPSEIQSLNFFSTHNMSPGLMINYLQNSTSADISFLAVQPKSIIYGENLSHELENRLIEFENFFVALNNKGTVI